MEYETKIYSVFFLIFFNFLKKAKTHIFKIKNICSCFIDFKHNYMYITRHSNVQTYEKYSFLDAIKIQILTLSTVKA